MRLAIALFGAVVFTAAGAVAAYVAGMREILEGGVAWGQITFSALSFSAVASLIWAVAHQLPNISLKRTNQSLRD